MDCKTIDPILEALAQAGFTQVRYEAKGEILILKFPQDQHSSLLEDVALRQTLVSQAISCGFSRLCLDVSP